jgi:hypothetical protein
MVEIKKPWVPQKHRSRTHYRNNVVQFAFFFIDMLNQRSDVRQISESIPHQHTCVATPKKHILHHGRLETKK